MDEEYLSHSTAVKRIEIKLNQHIKEWGRWSSFFFVKHSCKCDLKKQGHYENGTNM